MEGLLPIIIQLVSGAVGGNVAGAVLKNFNLGTLWNSILGIVGGGLGGTLLNSVLGAGAVSTGAGLDIATILGNVASGGVGGGVLLAVVGIIRKVIAK